MGIEGAIRSGSLSVTKIIAYRQRPQGNDRRRIDHLWVFALGHGLVDCRLEAFLIDHQACGGQAGDLPRSELQVVRLRPGLGQVGNGGMTTRNALSDELQWIKRGHDTEPTRLPAVVRASRSDGYASRNRHQW
jgi:hypothetical protein